MARFDSAPASLPAAGPRAGKLGMYAGFVTRAAALMMDLILVTVAVLVINALIGLPVAFFTGINLNNCAQTVDPRAAAKAVCTTINLIWVGVALLAGPIYFITLFATTGQTIGKSVMGVRVVRLDGRAMTFKTGAVRWLGYFVSVITLGLGFFWVIVDSRRQGFHDRLANTSVIYAWRATGSERMLERVRLFLGRHHSIPSAPMRPVPLPSASSYELLALAAPDLARIGDTLQALHGMVANAELTVLATAVLLKAADGQVSSVAGDMLSAEDAFRGLTGLPRAVTPDVIATVTHDIAPANYVLFVLLEEQAADMLVQRLTRRAPILVSRCTVAVDATTLSVPVVVQSA